MSFDLKQTLEALLLSTSEPLAVKEVVALFARYHQEQPEAGDDDEEAGGTDVPSLVTRAQVREAFEALRAEAEAEDRVYRLAEGPNGFQLVTAPRFAEFVRLLRGNPSPLRLSPAALETLAIIAYRQPVTRAEMEAVRGVSIDSALNKLIEHELVRVTGRAELPGRPIQYGTTDKFLEFTGIAGLDALPASDVLSSRQIDEWMRRGEQPEEVVGDEEVGLAREPDPGELPLDEEFVELDWSGETADGGGETEESARGRQ